MTWAAIDLSKDQKLNFGDEIAYQLRVAKKKRFNVMEEKRINEEIELQTYLNSLMLDEKEKQLDELRKNLVENKIDETEAKETEQSITDKCDERINELNSIFAQIDLRRRVS